PAVAAATSGNAAPSPQPFPASGRGGASIPGIQQPGAGVQQSSAGIQQPGADTRQPGTGVQPPTPDIRQQLVRWLADGVAHALPDAGDIDIKVERPRDATHGDFASNVAMVAAKRQRRNPRELAQAIVAALPPSPIVARTDIAGAGFINIVLAPAARQSVVARVLAERD